LRGLSTQLDVWMQFGLIPEHATQLDLALHSAGDEGCLDLLTKSPVLMMALLYESSCLPRPPEIPAPLDVHEAWHFMGRMRGRSLLETLSLILPIRHLPADSQDRLESLRRSGTILTQRVGFQFTRTIPVLQSLLDLLVLHPDFSSDSDPVEWSALLKPLIRYLHPQFSHVLDAFAGQGNVDMATQRLADFMQLALTLSFTPEFVKSLPSALWERLDLQPWQIIDAVERLDG
jgi:hypothetical protein